MTDVNKWQAVRADMLDVLRQVAAHGDTISYSEFGRMLKAPMHHRNPALYDLLRDICYDEAQAGRPNLCALVVRKSDGIPGKGFFEAAAFKDEDISNPIAYWQRRVQECWDYYKIGEDSD